MIDLVEYDQLVSWMRNRGVACFDNGTIRIQLGPEPKVAPEPVPEPTAEQRHESNMRERRATIDKLFAATSMRPAIR